LLYILYGEDSFSIREELSKIKAESGGAELGESNRILIEGDKVSLNELVSICNTMTFLSPKRLVIVEGLLARFEPKGKRRGGDQPSSLKVWNALTEHTINMPETTVLVLVDGKLSRTNPLLKKLSPHARIKEHIPPKDLELQSWIRARVTGNGCKICPSALRLLTGLIGGNLWILSNEIDKLCVHAGDTRIEESDVNSLVS